MDSASLATKLQQYDANPVTSASALNEALGTFGVPEIRKNVAGLRTTVANTTNALNNVDPSVTGRTQGSLVTEAQRQRQVANERAPISQELATEGGQLGDQEKTLQDALSQATTQANNKVSDYQSGRAALSDQYSTTYKREQDAADAARAAAQDAEQRRQFNVSAASKGASGSSKPLTQTQTVAAIRQGLESVKGKDNHVAPADLAQAYKDWLGSGFDDASFWKNFQGYWNSAQGNYKQQFNASK